MSIKKRSLAVCILLSIITCGIYYIFWFIGMVDDLNKISNNPNAKSGVVVFLLSLVTCGIYGLIWRYRAGEILDTAAVQRGLPATSKSLLFLLLSIFGLSLIADAILQDEINKYATV